MMDEGSFNTMALAQLVNGCRKQSGLTQIELAQLAGVGKTTIYDIEKGKVSIRFDTLCKVLEVLNIHIEFKTPLPFDSEVDK